MQRTKAPLLGIDGVLNSAKSCYVLGNFHTDSTQRTWRNSITSHMAPRLTVR